jgi:hypothetical protein
MMYTQAQRDADIEAAIEDIERRFKHRFELAFGTWEDERDQVQAIAFSIVQLLAPKPDEDSPRFTEWRLAQVIESMLGDTAGLTACKEYAGYSHE